MTYQERNQAIGKLKAAGWTKLCSVMHDGDKSNMKYGTLWTSAKGQFYFNDQTFRNLPV